MQEGAPSQLGMSAMRYDSDYPVVAYSGTATGNPIARLQSRLLQGKVKLEFSPGRGYLDSILKNLAIDRSSQTLVYSKTSLQTDWINAATPRAIYFNDDTYVAWVQGSGVLEFMTMDRALGPVFYTLTNRLGSEAAFARVNSQCLVCHDKFSMQGGGVPMFLSTSSYVDVSGLQLQSSVIAEVTDQTPIAARWGGWYVTGEQGRQVHLGNILVDSTSKLADEQPIPRGNLSSLAGLLDTQPYLTDKSDIVALLMLEHQLTVYNLITRINFKARTVVALNAVGPHEQGSWDALPAKVRSRLRQLMEPLVQALLFVDAAPLTDTIVSGSGFDGWFQSRGPYDKRGRSLRELDLKTRLFKYPVSYLIYSPAFDGLPDYVRGYVYDRLTDILSGRAPYGASRAFSVSDRQAALAILTETKPEFAWTVAYWDEAN